MARIDGNETGGTGEAGGGSAGGSEGVDIGEFIDTAPNPANDPYSGGAARKRSRRTREQLIADGYYEGKDVKPTVRPAAKATRGSLDVNSIQFALTGIHALLAAGMATPELELTEAEAETVAKNIVAVSRHYDLQQTAKATDWGNCVVSLGVVYGGRLIRISARKRAEKLARKSTPSAGFVVTPPNTAPQQPQTATPKAASGNPPTRARTREDDMLLNEHEPFLAP